MYLCRDLDSRFSKREAAAVGEWLQSSAAIHVMRDHPQHGAPLLGGLWGARVTDKNIRLKVENIPANFLVLGRIIFFLYTYPF